MAACGSAEPEAPVDSTPDSDILQPVAPTQSEGEAEAADWNDYADTFTLTFKGVAATGESVALAMTEDKAFAALAVVNTDSMESVSFVGVMTPSESEDEAADFTIADEASGRFISFSARFDFDAGTGALDMGEEYGSLVVYACAREEVFELLNAIEADIITIS